VTGRHKSLFLVSRDISHLICYDSIVSKRPPKPLSAKVLDEEIVLSRPRRGAKLREEVWEDKNGTVVKYNLAYINHVVCRVDNGRVLGYDNNHDQHHQHFMGNVEPVEFNGYEPLVRRFRAELKKLWRKENEGAS